MKRLSLFSLVLILLIILCSCSASPQTSTTTLSLPTTIETVVTTSPPTDHYKEMYEQLLLKQPPEIISIQFKTMDGQILKENNNWVELKIRVTIRVELNGSVTSVELYVVPTGTETYKLQQLVDEVIPQGNVAKYIWDVPESTMGQFWVVAYNGDVGRKSETINVIRQD